MLPSVGERRQQMERPKGKIVTISYGDGERFLIKSDMVTAVKGNDEGTTIYFHGNYVTIKNPLDEILNALDITEMSNIEKEQAS